MKMFKVINNIYFSWWPAAIFPALILCGACSKKSSGDAGTPVAPVVTTVNLAFPVNLLADSVILGNLRISQASDALLAGAWNTLVASPANNAINLAPAPVVSVSSDNFANVQNQGNQCRIVALQWLYLFREQPEQAKPFFNKVLSNLLAWVNAGNVALTHIPNETAYLGFFEAYSIIRSRVPLAERTRIDQWLDSKAIIYRNFAPRVNNWETIRLCLLFYLGHILNNEVLLNHAESAYTTLLNVNIFANGVSEDFTDRDAFAYHAYNLAFYGRIARVKYNYEGKTAMETWVARKNIIGMGLQDMIRFWEPYLLDPANNRHLEFVNTKYAPDKTRSDYNKPYNPASSVYALEELLLAFPHMKQNIAQVVPGATRYNRTVIGMLLWP